MSESHAHRDDVDTAMAYLGDTWPMQKNNFTEAQLAQWRKALFGLDLEHVLATMDLLALTSRFRPDPAVFIEAYRSHRRAQRKPASEPTQPPPSPEEHASGWALVRSHLERKGARI